MKLDFYLPDKSYVEYLQKREKEKRGFSHVPNMEYGNREDKFVCGTVLKIKDTNYYVPVSSYSKKQPDNILIEIPKDKWNPVKGSLRFNYMFPIPDECIKRYKISNITDDKRRRLVKKELDFCLDNEVRIRNRARQTYSKVINQVNLNLVRNSCDFSFLEECMVEFCEQQRTQKEIAATKEV